MKEPVFFVSHDRYFINKTATRILNLTGKKIINYIGNYDYYMEKREGTGKSVSGQRTDRKMNTGERHPESRRESRLEAAERRTGPHPEAGK